MTPDAARDAVQLQADFYREALLVVHESYVTDGKPASATVLKQVFAGMTRAGWPEARWLAVNGHPVNPENVPRDPWETEAARQVRHGATLVEKIEKGGYRAVVAVPFTGACLKCHWGDRPNDYTGAITFRVPLSRTP